MRMNANASVCVPLYTHLHLCAFFISRFFMHAHQVYIARQRSLEAVSCTTIKRIHEVCVCVWCVCGVCVCARSMCMSICKCACLSDSVPTKVFICILFIIICNGDQESITSMSVMVSLY